MEAEQASRLKMMLNDAADVFVEVIAERVDYMQGRRQRVFDMEKTAEYLGVTENAVYQMVKEGKLKPVRWDARNRFDVYDLDQFIAAHRNNGKKEKE
jgi:excisionase family DNA binding protein